MGFRSAARISVLVWWAVLPTLGLAQTLRQEAAQAGVLVGTAVNPVYFSEPAYTALLAREFDMLEPEEVMKWNIVRPDAKTFEFGPADTVVDFARTHGMRVRGHTLVWASHNPEWLTNGHYTPKQLSRLLREHIQTVVQHFHGQVYAWDVVNEALEEHGKLRSSPWYDRPGIKTGRRTGYIEQAFRWAHEADPDALLFYNDAEAEEVNRKSDAIYAMVKKFKRRGVPIDGVGLQMHILNLKPNLASIDANIARFTKLGLQVHITEMDVALPVDSAGHVLNPADLTRQAEIYGAIADTCLRYSGCTALQTWGFTDKYSWIGRFTHGSKGAPLLFNRRYQPKPAYEAFRQAITDAASRGGQRHAE